MQLAWSLHRTLVWPLTRRWVEYQETGTGFLTPSLQKQLFERHEAHLLNKQEREKPAAGHWFGCCKCEHPPLLFTRRMSHLASRGLNPQQLLPRHTPAPNYHSRAQCCTLQPGSNLHPASFRAARLSNGPVCCTQKLISSGDVDVCTESLAPYEISVLGGGLSACADVEGEHTVTKVGQICMNYFHSSIAKRFQLPSCLLW